MWGWVFTIIDSVVLLVCMRWLFRLATPQADIRTVSGWLGRARRWVLGWRVHLRDALGLTTEAWQRLRADYQAGRYGVEGT